MKKIIFLAVLTMFLISLSPALAIEKIERFERTATAGAINVPPHQTGVNVGLQRQQKKEAVLNNKTTNLKDRAAKEIERRLTSLNDLISKINGIKKITDAQKSSFSSQIQTEIVSLNTLKTKIDADTDLTALKTDVQSIIKSYRVYALFLPKINILLAADGLDNLADKLSTIAIKLETKINDAKVKGTDVATLNSLLSNLNSKTDWKKG